MIQPIIWETITTKTTVTFGVLARLKVIGGWLVSNKSSASSTSSILTTFVPDPLYKWTQPEITWETLVNKGISYGTTVRARVGDGWLIGHRIGTTISSRTLSYTEDKEAQWLKDPVVEPIPIPTPIPSTKWIGTNLGGLVDWSTEYPFKNFMLNSRAPFSAPASGGWNDTRSLNLDSKGNILSLLPDQIARRVVFTGQRPVVDLLLTWEGNGVISFGGFNLVSSPTTNSRIIRPSDATGNAWININSVDAANPIRNMQLVRVDQKDIIGPFNPDYVNDLKRYACIRFMDWQNTNILRSSVSLQSDFVTLDSLPVTLDANAPVELMIELCNQTDVDAWFCIPINADSVYIDRFLNLIKNKLKTNLKARIELSNEVWNTRFPQHNAVGGSTFDERMLNYAIKTSDLHAKTKAILGTRGVSVLGAQAVNTWWMNHSIEHIKRNNKPLPEVLSTAPYFGENYDDVNALADGRVDKIIADMIKLTADAVLLAEKNGMRVELYEAGQHFLPGILMSRDLRMGSAYKTYLSGMKTVLKGNLLCHFSYAGTYSQWGAWGEKEYMYAPDSAKSLAIKDLM